MRYIWQHLETIIGKYTGGEPLTHFLKQYFKAHPKLGSRDRKLLSEMCYCWYRCSKAIQSKHGFEEKINICLFLCNTENKHALNMLPEQWREAKFLPLKDKVEMLQRERISVLPDEIIGYQGELSSGIVRDEWLESLLKQPALFIRIRKSMQQVIDKLEANDITFSQVGANCLRLPNGTAIDKILSAQMYVIQDVSSQQTGNYFRTAYNEQWWDCCSGAGGKSLLLKDMEPTIKLTVTDKRKTILYNLKERFALYGHKTQQAHVLDMSDVGEVKRIMQGQFFDNIICDVPCTGSGTWARTPEQAYFFNEQNLQSLSELQYTIAGNTLPFLKQNGLLYYITCSVFKKENEKVVEKLIAQNSLELKEMKLINGLADSADCLFIAVLQKQ